MAKWGVLVVLAFAQFLMVLDQAVMNVAISQLVEDFDTTVTTIQMVIALYALVMAGLMLTGGKLGDIWGRRRAFAVGLVIYGIGSGLTAASWSVPSLMFGWSILEGIGAALVLPALVALVAGNYKGTDRAIAYGVLGGVAGAGIAVGPILGGWMTTDFTWRLVFVGEVVVAIGILLGTRLIREPEREGGAPALDWVGSVLSASGLALIVFGVLQASNWGWLAPRASPIEPFGFSLTPFVIAAGALVLGGFVSWERRREEHGLAPLVHLGMLRIRALRGGVSMLLAQNLILMGIFFTIPLYLQIVQGLDALETGVQMLPASAGLFLAAIAGSVLAKRFAPRALVRVGLLIVFAAIAMLLGTIEPELDSGAFLAATGVLGTGMGLIVSQLGNVVQSAVGDADRSEAGGLQNTAQQLGSSLGTALLGAIVISGLIFAFTSNIADDPRVSADVEDQVQVQLSAGGSFVASEEVRVVAKAEGIDPAGIDALVENYEDAQLKALKTAFLFAAFLVLASFWTSRRLPTQRFDELQAGPDPPLAEPAPT
jgi:EmrB/QacA subfamily drug resistance transporter